MAQSTEDFMALLEGAMGQQKTLTGRTEEPKTIEEAMERAGADKTVSVGVQGEGRAVPIPRSDMSLREIKDIIEKLGAVVDRGGYLYEWTAGKGAKNDNLDPVQVGIERMTEEEKIAYNWWKTKGDPHEYDGVWGEKSERVPAGKEVKYRRELAALRHMYGNKDLVMSNWFWLRNHSNARAHVVWALVKILAAAEDLRGGRDNDDVLGFAEYQTSIKVISETSTFVKKFMEDVHKLLRPIDTNLNKVIARKVAIGRRIGIAQKVEGTANRMSKKYGGGEVGVVDETASGPRGVKRQREETITIAELRKLKISKKDPVDQAASGPVPQFAQTSGVHSTHDQVMTDPQWAPADHPAPTPKGDWTSKQVEDITAHIKQDVTDQAFEQMVGKLKTPPFRRERVLKYAARELESKPLIEKVPVSFTATEKVVIYAINCALDRARLTKEEALASLHKVDPVGLYAKTAFFLDAASTANFAHMLAQTPDA